MNGVALSAAEGRHRSEGENFELFEGSSKPCDIPRITRGNYRCLEEQGRCDDKRVDGVSRGKLGRGKKVACTARYDVGEVANNDAASIEKPIEGGVESRTPIDFRKDRRRNPNEGPSLVRYAQNRAGSLGEHPSFRRVCEGVDSLRVEN